MSGADDGARPSAWRRHAGIVSLVVLWVASVTTGFSALAAYSSTPGAQGSAPRTWPTESALRRSHESPTLLVVLHPHCSCSRATIAELRRLLHDARTRPETWVVFVLPEGMPEEWERTGTWFEANAIEGVRTFVDHGGVEARRFGAATSGHTLLFDRDGHLLFQGGITPSRGHEGDNEGRSRIVSLLDGGGTGFGLTHVFGCPVEEDPRSTGGKTR